MYAVFAAAIIGSLFFSPADPARRGDEALLSLGQSIHHRDEAGHRGLVSFEYRPDQRLDPPLDVGSLRDLRPLLGVGLSPDHTRFLYAGLRKELRWGTFKISPSFAPTLYQPFGQDDPHARLQFRTALELHAAQDGPVQLGGGYFHISNGTLTRRNAAIDALFLSLRLRF